MALFVDEFSRHEVVGFLRAKDESFQVYEPSLWVQSNRSVKRL